ncbi:MAG: hypothetical protein ACOYLN_08365, partial [Blastocatellia bacterium]
LRLVHRKQDLVDGRFHAAQTAVNPRPDLVVAGATSTSAHGFSFDLRTARLSPGRHTLNVFVVRKGLNGHLVLIPLSDDERSFFLP